MTSARPSSQPGRRSYVPPVPRALVLGGTGQIGLATARRLLVAGWDVDLTGRDPTRMPNELAAAGARFVAADRGDAGELAAAVGSGADLLRDCICFTAADAALLLPLAGAAG
jgi:nucleoside-diphosphate-sugar epimerase